MAWRDVDSSFERFCLTAGIGAIEQMLREDAEQLTGAPHSRGGGRVGHRWGTTAGKIGFHGGKVTVHRPPVRSFDGREAALPTWTAAQAEDWLGRWAMNLMLINVSTRKLRRAVRLPEGDLAGHCRGWHLEVCRLAPVRGVVGRAAGRVDGV
jgi:putative transposase